MNKICSLLIILLSLATGVQAQAPQPVHDGMLSAVGARLMRQGEVLDVSLELQMLRRLPTGKTLEVTPLLTDGEHSLMLDPVTFMGRSKMREYRRLMALRGSKRRLAEAPTQVEPGFPPLPRKVQYHVQVPFEAWMGAARLELQAEQCNCGGSPAKLTTDPLQAQLVMEAQKPAVHLAFVRPEVEQLKQREASGEAHLQYIVNQWDIRENLGDNAAELQRIRNLIEGVRGDEGVEIRSLVITGYASPEGPLENNQRLSENRARSMADYIAGNYGIRRSIITSHYGGENWLGLAELVAADSTMAGRKQVQQVLATVAGSDDRKQQLQKLMGGAPYRYMLQTMYPRLRRSVVVVHYDVRNFTLEEAQRVMRERPQNLSLAEIYMVANALPQDSQEYAEAFETAVLLYPQAPAANLNAAIAALQQGNLQRAELYLQKVEGTELQAAPEYENALGALERLRGNAEAARRHFQQAGQLPEAAANLQDMQK